MKNNSVEPKNILLVSLSGIGNFLMQSPAFKAVKKYYPDSRITVWLAPRGTRVLAEQNPYIDAIIESPIKLSALQHLKLVYRLTQQKFDTGIMLSPGQLWKGAAYLYLAGVPRRIGNAYPFRGNPNSYFLLNYAVPELGDLHDIEQNLRLLEPLGIKNTESAHYELSIEPSFIQKADQLFKDKNIPTDRKLVGFHMGSAPNFGWKRWPVENFIDTARILVQKHNAHILLFGDTVEKTLNEHLVNALPGTATIIEADLLTTAAAIKRCALFISNDSGLMHVAAAVGAPTFGLFGPTNEVHTGPRGIKSYVIRAPGTQPAYHTEKNYDLGSASHATMQKITPNQVIDEISSSL